jgi:hypothetical protein
VLAQFARTLEPAPEREIQEESMKIQDWKRTAMALAFGALCLAATPPAMAQDDDPNEPTDADRECIMTCRDTDRDCRFDSREAYKLCLEESGCDTLAADYRAACLVEDRDEEACAAARTALRECREPCRDTAETSNRACREAFATCVSETCGIDAPPHGKPGRPGPGRGGPGHHGPRPGGPRGPR